MGVDITWPAHRFDDAFHVSAFLCKELLVPLTNEVFGLKLPKDTRVLFLSELQTVLGPDGAVDVFIPRSAVIYLKNTSSTPELSEVRLHTPGGMVKYSVPSVRLGSYRLEEIFERELYLLIPFYLLRYYDDLENIDTDENRVRELIKEMGEIERRLHEAENEGRISAETAIRIDRQYQMIKNYLMQGTKNIKQEEETMDKSYWEDDWSIINDPLFYKEEALAEGTELGTERHLIEQICKKLKRGKDIPQIADEVEEREERVQLICDIAERFAPDYDADKVFEAVRKERVYA